MCILANPSAQCKQTSIIVLRLSCCGNTNGSGFYTFSILGRHQVFLLYALELDNFCDVAHADCPAYNLVIDFIQFLKYLNINCYHDAFERLTLDAQDFTHQIEKAIQNSKVVIIVCSEVLHTAFNDSTCDTLLVQMKFGKISLQSIRKLVIKSPEKFIPVALAGLTLPPCKELQHQRCYSLQDFETFMDKLRDGFHEGGISELLKSEKRFSELQDFVDRLQGLLNQTS